MNITPEIKAEIEYLATIIDYGMYCVDALSCIKHYNEECDDSGRFWGQTVIDSQIQILGCQAYFIIYKDILNYTEKQLEELCDNEFEMVNDVIDALKLNDDDVVYSKEALTHYITKYIEDMVWDEEFRAWHPDWK